MSEEKKILLVKAFYDINEVCVITGLHRNTILNLIQKDELKAKKLGGKWLIRTKEFWEFMKKSD